MHDRVAVHGFGHPERLVAERLDLLRHFDGLGPRQEVEGEGPDAGATEFHARTVPAA